MSYADLQRELTEAHEQQAVTSETLRVIANAPTDIQPVLDTMAESVYRLCLAQDAIVWLRDGERLSLAAHHGSISFAPVGEYSIALSGTVSGRSILEARTIQVSDLSVERDAYPAGSAIVRQWGFRTTLAVPLVSNGVAIGTINVRRVDVQPFTDRQIALLKTFADQAVIAIQNVRLFTETKEALDRQTATRSRSRCGVPDHKEGCL